MAIINKKVTTQAQTQFHVGTDGNLVMTATSDGNVGIGTSSPAKLLSLSESADGTKLRITRGGVSEWDFSIGNTSTLTGVGSGALELLPLNANTANEFAIGTAGSSAPLFHLTNSQAYFAGNVGIGTTTTFSNPLTLNKAAGAAGSLNNQLAMTHTGASTAYHIKTIRAAATDEPAGLAFVENTTEHMRLNSLGQLCIGDASYFPTSGTNAFYMRKDSTSTQFLSHYNLQGGLVSRYYGDYGNDGTIAELQIKVGDEGNYAKIQTWSNSVLKFGTNNTYAMEIGTNGSLYVGGTQQGADINDGRLFSFISSTSVPACRFAQGSTSTGIPVMRIRHENASNGNYIEFRTDENVLTGQIYDSSGTMQYASASDQRLKENIEPMTEGLTEVLAMNPVKYTLKDIVTENKTIPMDGAENRGFLAQELNEQYPWAVQEGGEDPNMNPWSVDYGKLTPILVKAIQELSAKLEAAEARIETLENP